MIHLYHRIQTIQVRANEANKCTWIRMRVQRSDLEERIKQFGVKGKTWDLKEDWATYLKPRKMIKDKHKATQDTE